MHRANALAARVAALPVLPVIAVLCAAQVGLGFWFAFNTPHNGWLWYSGGDATSYWTDQWAVGHFLLAPAAIGFGLPVYYAWVPLVAGPSLLTGAKVVALFQLIVLVPLAVALFWAVADRLFGRVYAWSAALLWVLWPLLALRGFVGSYHWVFDQLFLVPHWFGLTDMADMPSMVAVLASVWLTLRAVDERSPTDALLGGLLGGVALGLKPANAFFLPAMAVLLIGARRPRLAALWVAALAPSVFTLVLWKFRGLGYLPVAHAAYTETRLAAGTTTALAFSGSKYLPLDFRHLNDELGSFRQVFWSLRFVEFLAVAGAFGLIRKAPLKGTFVVAWFACFGIVKASSSQSDFPNATYFRLAEPGLPAFLLIALGVAFCVPALGRRATRTAPAAPDAFDLRRIDLRKLVPAAVVCALVPLVLVAAVRNPSTNRLVRDENRVQEAPLTGTLQLRAVKGPGKRVTLTWTKPNTHGTDVTFLVLTSGDDNGCVPIEHGQQHCKLNTMTTLGETGNTRWVDKLGSYRRKWYRVALAASYNGFHGDLMLVSRPVKVTS